jgi:hypothetical protein
MRPLPSEAPPFFWRAAARETFAGRAVIGRDEQTLFCVEPHGEVLAVDPDGVVPQRFVNASADHLARFLDVFAPAWRAWRDVDDADAQLADGESFWSVVLEQMHDGLL